MEGTDETTKPDYTALTQPLSSEVGAATLHSLQNKFNYDGTLPVLDFLQKSYFETVKPQNPDYRDQDQDGIEITISGNNTDFVEDIKLCMDIQPVLKAAGHAKLTGTVPRTAAANAGGNAGNTDALQCIQRPMTPYLMFKSVSMEVNQSKIDFNRDNTNTYAFSTFLQLALNMNMEDEARLKESHDFDLPPANEDMDAAVPATLNQTFANSTEWQKDRRQKMLTQQRGGDGTTTGRQTYMVPLEIPILKSLALPVVGANITIKLSKADERVLFHHNAAGNANNVEMQIHEVKLLVKRIALQKNMLKAVLDDVNKKGNFKFNVTHLKTMRHNLPAGDMSWNNQSLQSGSKPTMVWISFVNDQALSGNTTHSPFSLQNLQISKSRVSFDGNYYPYPNGYEWLHNSTELDRMLNYQRMCHTLWGNYYQNTDRVKWWTRDRFENFCHVQVFDITDTSTGHLSSVTKHPDQSGVLGVDLDFNAAIPANIVAMVTTLFTANIFLSNTTLTPDMDVVGV